MQINKALMIVITSGIIGGCASQNDELYQTYTINSPDDRIYYQETMTSPIQYNDMYGTVNTPSTVQVPDSYHVGNYRKPVMAKDQDRNWISNQNPNAYTIQLADDPKAAVVAEKLSNAPKSEHMAEVKYQNQGQSYYKGVYGSYSSHQEAVKAYEALPAAVKQGAEVRQWQQVQTHIGE